MKPIADISISSPPPGTTIITNITLDNDIKLRDQPQWRRR